jgi:hypothetical protein
VVSYFEDLLTSGQRPYEYDGEIYHEEFSWHFWLYEGGDGEFVRLNDQYMGRTVKTVGGHEGGGEYVEIVVEVSPHVDGKKKFSFQSRFFKKLGWYQSYHGVDMDGTFKEVFPKQKTITVYEEE